MLFGWILGILMAKHLDLDFQAQSIYLLYFLVCATAIYLIKNRAGVISIILACIGGYLTFSLQQKSSPADFPQNLYLYIEQPPVEKPKSVAVQAQVIGYQDQVVQDAKMLLYLEKTDKACMLQEGDIIQAESTWRRIEDDSLSRFKATSYYSTKGIYHQTFVRDRDWKLMSAQAPKRNFFEQLRTDAKNTIAGWPMQSEAKQIMYALVLGDRSDLDPHLRQQYANAGVVHILAVSGLHVGVLYLLISLIFQKLLSGRAWRFQAFITLAVLWSYALMTGLSPSVWRAATMFSLLSVGVQIGRITNIYSTLAASAFILLILDSSLLFSPGFQLSYAAVFGIVRYQPIIAECWEPKSKWMNYAWQLASVSLAAQLVTMPFTLVYFGQFPTYFLLANLLILPLLSVIMIGSIGALLLGSLVQLPFWVLYPLDLLYLWENFVVKSINRLPYATLTHFDLSWQMGVLMMFFSLMMLEAIKYRSGFRLKLSLAGLGIFVLFSFPSFDPSWGKEQQFEHKGVTFYHYKYHGIQSDSVRFPPYVQRVYDWEVRE
jgi:competence protein ComEC